MILFFKNISHNTPNLRAVKKQIHKSYTLINLHILKILIYHNFIFQFVSLRRLKTYYNALDWTYAYGNKLVGSQLLQTSAYEKIQPARPGLTKELWSNGIFSSRCSWLNM